MPEPQSHYHISSAVIMARPAMQEAVLAQLSTMTEVEVHAYQDGKIVIVIEGGSAGALGDCLSRISLLDGVLAANMVFEHIEKEEMTDNDRGIDAA